MPRQAAPLVLASGSPRRRELLAGVGLTFEVDPVPADESVGLGESPLAYVERVSRHKLEVALAHLAARAPDAFVLTADTIVALDGEVLGKPESDAQALETLRRLRARAHEVTTAVAIGTRSRGLVDALRVTTVVRFRDASDDELVRYVATGEGRDKAGAYAIQGIGGGLVASITGSYSNVVGLPVAETLELLRRVGALLEWP